MIPMFWSSSRKPQPARRKHRRGMTLIEIMVVLVILGMIAGAIGYNVFQQLQRAQVDSARLDLRKLSDSIDMYRVEQGSLPDQLQNLVPKILKEVRKDPWGTDYKYVKQGDNYQVYSYGPDKAQGGGDDVIINGGADSSAKAGQ